MAGDAVESRRDAVGVVPDPSSRSYVRDAEAAEVRALTRSQALRIIHGGRPPKLRSPDAQLLAFASCCEVSVFVWCIAYLVCKRMSRVEGFTPEAVPMGSRDGFVLAV